MNRQKRLGSLLIILVVIGLGLAITAKLRAQESPQQISTIPSQSTSLPTTPSQPSSFSPAQTNSVINQSPSVPPANPEDPSIAQHTLPSGGRADIVQIGAVTASQPEAYTGDDITFTVTIENVAPYKKFVKQFCFNSNEGNFGCSPGFNLNPGQIFSISNSGRFTSSGVKSVGVSWTQDGVNFYSPINAESGSVDIL